MKKEKSSRLDLKGQSIDAIINQLNKKYGENTLVKASEAVGLKVKFISTGVYALDLATGGGIPENRITELRGPFSTLKSTVCYKTIANFHKTYPEGIAFYEDGEQSFDPEYAGNVGVDCERVVVINSDSGEQAVDVMTECLDIGVDVLVIIDSIATLVPSAEIEASMDQQFQGLHPRLVNRMLRMLRGHMKRNLYDSTAPKATVVATNQMRDKIGVVYGDPTTSPGGKGREHYCSLMVKFLSSPSDRFMEKIVKYGQEREVRMGQKVRFTITKSKVGGSQFEEGEFLFYIRPYKGHPAFSINNEEVLFKYGVFYGVIQQSGSLYSFHVLAGRKEDKFKKGLMENANTSRKLYKKILSAMLDEMGGKEVSVPEVE